MNTLKVNLFSSGFETVSGTIKSINDKIVIVEGMKGSKTYTRIIPIEKSIIIQGKEGEEGYVSFISETLEVEKPFEAFFKGIKNGLILLELEDGDSVLVNPKFSTLISKPEKQGKKKKHHIDEEEIERKKIIEKRKIHIRKEEDEEEDW